MLSEGHALRTSNFAYLHEIAATLLYVNRQKFLRSGDRTALGEINMWPGAPRGAPLKRVSATNSICQQPHVRYTVPRRWHRGANENQAAAPHTTHGVCRAKRSEHCAGLPHVALHSDPHCAIGWRHAASSAATRQRSSLRCTPRHPLFYVNLHPANSSVPSSLPTSTLSLALLRTSLFLADMSSPRRRALGYKFLTETVVGESTRLSCAAAGCSHSFQPANITRETVQSAGVSTGRTAVAWGCHPASWWSLGGRRFPSRAARTCFCI